MDPDPCLLVELPEALYPCRHSVGAGALRTANNDFNVPRLVRTYNNFAVSVMVWKLRCRTWCERAATLRNLIAPLDACLQPQVDGLETLQLSGMCLLRELGPQLFGLLTDVPLIPNILPE